MFSLYILEISPYQSLCLQIFFPILSCLFISFMGSLAVQRLLRSDLAVAEAGPICLHLFLFLLG